MRKATVSSRRPSRSVVPNNSIPAGREPVDHMAGTLSPAPRPAQRLVIICSVDESTAIPGIRPSRLAAWISQSCRAWAVAYRLLIGERRLSRRRRRRGPSESALKKNGCRKILTAGFFRDQLGRREPPSLWNYVSGGLSGQAGTSDRLSAGGVRPLADGPPF